VAIRARKDNKVNYLDPEEAVQLTETHFARFWTAEVYRLKGELLLAQDQADAAQTLLAEIYGGFSEGFDTIDLQTAKDMLARCQSVA
jgi:hypothetical protein